MKPSVVRGTAINLATRLLAVGLVLLITAYTARLGTATQGAFALFTSVEGVLLALLSGFGIALARRISHHGDGAGALLGAVVVACIAIGAGAGLVLWAASMFAGPAYATLWLLALAAPLLLLAPNVAGVWLGEGRMGPMAAVSIAPPALTLLGLGLLLQLRAASLLQVLSAWVVAKVAVGLGVLWIVWRSGRLVRPAFGALRSELPFVATIGITNLIGLLNYRAGLFVVEATLGLSQTGVYSIATTVAELLWFVSGSLTQAVYSRIGTPDRSRAAATTLRVVHLGVAALLVVAPLLWLAAGILVPLVLGPAYRASLVPLAWLLPGVLLFGGASALSAYFTNHAGLPQVPAQVAALSLGLNALLALLLVPRLGTSGAAIAASLAYAAAVLLLALRFARHAGLPARCLLRPAPRLYRELRALASRRRGES
jgi:O-antigen/teichoic acid export membrane protein